MDNPQQRISHHSLYTDTLMYRNPSLQCFALGVAVGAALLLLLRQCEPAPKPVAEIVTVHDTVYQVKHLPPLVEEKPVIKWRTQTKWDTLKYGIPIYVSRDSLRPFVDSATAIFPSGDTVIAKYVWPQRKLPITLLRAPDSTQTITITTTKTIVQEPSPWERVLYFLGGAAAGAIGAAIAK